MPDIKLFKFRIKSYKSKECYLDDDFSAVVVTFATVIPLSYCNVHHLYIYD